MNITLFQMKEHLKDIQELLSETEKGWFIPKKFRNKPFTNEMSKRYCDYLRNELNNLTRRIGAMAKPSLSIKRTH